MKRRGRRAVGVFRGVTAACLVAWCARAQAPEPRAADNHVTVDCPALDSERRAALEARAKADLIVRRETGALLFQCAGSTGTVAWSPASGQPLRGEHTLPKDADAAIESLLEAAERLLLSSHEAQVAAAALPPAVREPQAETAPPTPPPPVIAPPPPEPVAAPPGAERGRRGGVPLGLALGAAFEVWAWVPALGPTVVVGFHATPRLRIDAGGSLLFTTEDNLGIAGRLVRFHAGGEHALGDDARFRLGAGVLVETLKATATDGDAAQDTAFGGRVHGHYAAPLADAWRVAFGPFVSARTGPVRVELGSNEAFRIPVVTGGAEVQLEWDAR